MKAPFFVELLHRNKEVRHRYRLDTLPIRIGRGYDNDIILDDPHISAHHLIIDQADDGGLIARDLGSKNGIMHKRRRHREMAIDGNATFRLGQTNLRVRASDFPVEDEIADNTFYNWEGWLPATTGLALIICLTVENMWVGDTEKFELIRYITAVVSALCLGLIWCGFWSFANRLFGGSTRLGRHLFIMGCGLAAMEFWGFFSGTIAYALSLELFTRYSSHIVVAILAAMIFYHLLQIKPYRSRLFVMVSITVALLGSGLMLMINYNKNGQFADELFMSERLPPAFRLSDDKPINQFIRDAAKLKNRVDKERSKVVNGDEADSRDQD